MSWPLKSIPSIAGTWTLAEDPTTPNGVRSYRNQDNPDMVGKLTTFTVDSEIED